MAYHSKKALFLTNSCVRYVILPALPELSDLTAVRWLTGEAQRASSLLLWACWFYTGPSMVEQVLETGQKQGG